MAGITCYYDNRKMRAVTNLYFNHTNYQLFYASQLTIICLIINTVYFPIVFYGELNMMSSVTYY